MVRSRRHGDSRQCVRRERRCGGADRRRAKVRLRSHGLTPLARVMGAATAGVEPRIMGIGPAPASKKLLERHRLKISDIDVIELNEAFAAQALAVTRARSGRRFGTGERQRRLDRARSPAGRFRRTAWCLPRARQLAAGRAGVCAGDDVHRSRVRALPCLLKGFEFGLIAVQPRRLSRRRSYKRGRQMKSAIKLIAALVATVGVERGCRAGHQGRRHVCRPPARRHRSAFRSATPSRCCRRPSAGRKVQYIVLDDASDTTTAVKNARKLITEDKVDVMVGSTITPNSLAMIDVAAESETPMISMAASSAHRRARRCEASLGLQDAAERPADGVRHRQPHVGAGCEDGRLHRLCRRLRRRLVERVLEDRRNAGT
jgi:hypothetical protein